MTLHLPPTLLDQVLCNLITNSLQAGARQLTCRAYQQAGVVTLILQVTLTLPLNPCKELTFVTDSSG
nr:hypothetical protein [Yersinia bercovieri]